MDLRPPLREVAGRLARACERVGVDYAIIGGLAAGAYGATRPTLDVDACLSLAPEDAERAAALLEALRDDGFRLNLPALRRRLAAGRTLLFLWLGRVRLDLMLRRADGYWTDALAHRRAVSIGGRELYLATAEDVVVLKLAAGRPKDLEVVQQVLAVQLPGLDLERLRAGAQRLSLRVPDLPARLETVLSDVRDLLAEGDGPGEPS